jgi:sulfite reductase alpha subunit-like flavoprotein
MADKVARKYTGNGTYSGYDQVGEDVTKIVVASGQSVMMSKAKADQLERDFPDQWEDATAADVKKSAPEPEASAPAAAAPAPAKGKGKKGK